MRLPEDFGRRLVIAVALVSAGFLAAWLRFRPFLENEAVYTDGTRSYELDETDRLRFAVWDDPKPLPPWINTLDVESSATLSPDGRQLVFVVGELGLNADLFVADMVDGEPVNPRPLERLNSPEDELAPTFDGERLWFTSNRRGGAGGLDLWSAPWDDGRFGAPEWLGDGVNTRADETDPAPVPGTDALAFSSNRARGARVDFDLFLAVPQGFGTDRLVRRIDELNTPFDEREPAYTSDGSSLVFSSDREGQGGFDLWRSVQRQGSWLEPVPLPGLNSASDERSPQTLDDGFGLLFSRKTDAGDLDLQRARSRELTRVPGRPIGWWELTLLGLLLLLALLTWLGKRWEALDILAKCLLVSLLVHGALLWWFRDVEVGSDGVDLPEAPATFSVQLSAALSQPSATRERQGQVDAQPTQQRVAEPSRQASARESFLAERSETASEARLTAPTLSTTPAPTPSRSTAVAVAAAPAPQAVDARLPDVQLNATTETTAAVALPAPQMEVAPSSSRSRSTPSTQSVAQAPSRRGLASAPTSQASDVAPSSTTTATLSSPRVARANAPSRASMPALKALSPGVAASVEVSRSLPLESASTASTSSAVASASAADAPAALELQPSSSATSSAPVGRASAPVRAPGRPGATSSALAEAAPAASTALELGPVVSASSATPSARAPIRAAAPTRRTTGIPIEINTPSETSSSLAVGTPAPSPSSMAMPLAATTPLTSSSRSGIMAPARRAPQIAQVSPSPVMLPERGPTFTPLPEPVQAPMVAAAPLPETSPWEATPYQSRVGDAKERALVEFGGSVETERAVAMGLEYLAREQSSLGHWGNEDDYDSKYGHVAIGKTALCLLAFLGAGHTPGGLTEHALVSERAVDFLLAQQDDDTGHFGYSASYSHAVTTYALAETFALTNDERLRRPIDRAVQHILDEQNQEPDPRRFGGWGYYYPDGRIYDPWPRSSITAWQVMALESARLGGLEVPDKAFADARRFLRGALRRDRGVILYSHDPSRIRSRYWTLPGSTPAGLFALSILGDELREDTYRTTIDYVRERAPDGFRSRGDDAFVLRASGNLYFWYYGSLMLLRHGGRAWRVWNEDMQETILPAQQSDGSWRPISLYAEYAGDDEDDRAYTTAMCVLTLEVYYRYFTPLLQVK